MSKITLSMSLILAGVLLAGCGTSVPTIEDRLPTTVKSIRHRQDIEDLLSEGVNSRGNFNDIATPGVAEDGAAASSQSNSFVDTNVQVAGIQEGDIVKTDGSFIYYASPWSPTIRVLGVSSSNVVTELASISLHADDDVVYTDTMYLTDRYLIVIGYRYDFTAYRGCMETDENGDAVFCDYFPFWQPTGTVIFINRDTYQLDYTLRTDAAFMDHRIVPELNDEGETLSSTLFLIGHNYFYYNYTDDTHELRPYFIENEGEKVYMDYDDMFYFENSFVYGMTTLVGIPILDDASMISYNASAYLGAIADYKKVYVNVEHLYLAQSNYHWDETQSYQTTTLSKFGLDVKNATITFEAVVNLLGTAVNQFALDEYEGYFRIATTNEVYTYSSTTDWIWSNDNRTITNRLYILEDNGDGGFDDVAVIEEGLGKPGERIYSVRFEGPRAFIVTFERIDPLYIIDLSDPFNPVFSSEIVLPGFDTYQHVWDEEHLIGIGYNVDPETGWTGGMKITAYNTGENARELQTLIVSDYIETALPSDVEVDWSFAYSEALWNHKAILVSPEENVFGFAVNAYTAGRRVINEPTATDPVDGETSEDEDIPNADEPYEYYFEFHSLFVLFRFDFTSEEPILTPIIIEHPTSTYDYVNVDRGVMINDVIHTLSNRQVVSYSLSENNVIQTLVFA